MHRLARDRRGASTSGVLPSCSVTTGVLSVTGRRSRYPWMMPRQYEATTTPRPRRRAAQNRSRSTASSSRTSRIVAAIADFSREVRDEDETGLVTLTLLLHRLDGNLVVAEHAGDRGEHAGPVGGVERRCRTARQSRRSVGCGLVQRADRRAREPERRFLAASIRSPSTRARGRPTTGAPPEEHELADRLALDEHRVVRASNARERMVDRDHRGVHARADSPSTSSATPSNLTT